jgi:hypothetical protein
MTRLMPYEPLPASVLFALGWPVVWDGLIMASLSHDYEDGWLFL